MRAQNNNLPQCNLRVLVSVTTGKVMATVCLPTWISKIPAYEHNNGIFMTVVGVRHLPLLYLNKLKQITHSIICQDHCVVTNGRICALVFAPQESWQWQYDCKKSLNCVVVNYFHFKSIQRNNKIPYTKTNIVNKHIAGSTSYIKLFSRRIMAV